MTYSRRARRAAARYNPPCIHCAAPREVLPYSAALGLARKYVPGMLETLAEIQRFITNQDQMISVCPRCHCVTPDIHGLKHA